MKELVDEDVGGDLLQHPAVGVEEADVAPARDPEVGIARLAGAVDGAAEDGDLEVLRIRAQPLFDLLRQRLDTDVVAAARRTRDHDRTAFAKAERLQDLVARANLLDRVGGQRDADRVADPVDEQCSHPDGALDRPRVGRAGLGDAEVQWVRNLCAEHPVSPDHRRHVARLDRDLEVTVVELLEQPHLLERGLDERLGLILLREVVEVLGQRPGVGADPHRDPGLLRGVHYLLDLVGAADVARVDPDRRNARVDRLQGQAGVKVDVGDHRDRREADDHAQRLGILGLRYSAAHDLAAGGGESGDLRGRRLDVAGGRQRHRLDGDGRAAADPDAAHGDRTLARHTPIVVAAPDSVVELPRAIRDHRLQRQTILGNTAGCRRSRALPGESRNAPCYAQAKKKGANGGNMVSPVLLPAADAADVVRQADEEQQHDEEDPDRRDAFVDLLLHRPSAHALHDRERDVAAVER